MHPGEHVLVQLGPQYPGDVSVPEVQCVQTVELPLQVPCSLFLFFLNFNNGLFIPKSHYPDKQFVQVPVDYTHPLIPLVVLSSVVSLVLPAFLGLLVKSVLLLVFSIPQLGYSMLQTHCFVHLTP